MEINWTYNFLETIGFLALVIGGLYVIFEVLGYLVLWIFWGRGSK